MFLPHLWKKQQTQQISMANTEFSTERFFKNIVTVRPEKLINAEFMF